MLKCISHLLDQASIGEAIAVRGAAATRVAVSRRPLAQSCMAQGNGLHDGDQWGMEALIPII